MSKVTSTSVMARRVEPRDSLDDFPTPPWATRALCEWLVDVSARPDKMVVREPAANRGHMVRPLREYFLEVIASDVHNYGAGFPVRDYLFGPVEPTDWTITNPPFRLAEDFVFKALEASRSGVALIVRTAFLEGVGRYDRLFSQAPPSDILQFSERVVMHRGRLSPDGSTATAYAWLVWRKDFIRCFRVHPGPKFRWIGPCRRLLERDGDYPKEASATAPDIGQGTLL